MESRNHQLDAKTAAIGAALMCALAICAPLASSKQFIFSISQEPQTSNVLGATGVCAYVVASGKNKKGFYITSVGPTGNWRVIGLQPGDLLLSVDRNSIEDAESADNAIRKSAGNMSRIVFVRPESDGTPKFITMKTTIPNGDDVNAPASAIEPTPAIMRKEAADGASTLDRNSIQALEAYGGELINRDRNKEHSQPIEMNEKLTHLARDYAQYLINTNTFAHIDQQGRNPEQRAAEHGIPSGVYENLAYQTYGLGDERTMIDREEAQMMAEPRGQQNHRGNIVNPKHCCMGVGIARNGDRLVMVHEFTDTPP